MGKILETEENEDKAQQNNANSDDIRLEKERSGSPPLSQKGHVVTTATFAEQEDQNYRTSPRAGNINQFVNQDE